MFSGGWALLSQPMSRRLSLGAQSDWLSEATPAHIDSSLVEGIVSKRSTSACYLLSGWKSFSVQTGGGGKKKKLEAAGRRVGCGKITGEKGAESLI